MIEFIVYRKDRTGVQLKDKWRNLVKFNHLTDEEMKASCGGSARTRSGLRQCGPLHLDEPLVYRKSGETPKYAGNATVTAGFELHACCT